MQGKELIKATFKNKETERSPWVPFVGCHAGSLIEKKANEYLKDSDLLVEGQLKAVELYQPDGLPITFDLQIEAEALGCELKWEELNPPAVSRHILDDVELSELAIPDKNDGRIPMVLKATRKLRKKLPNTALYGLITGPFTLAMHLAGTKLFIDMYDQPEEVNKLLNFCRQVGECMAQAYLEAGCDVIAVVDPMTTQIGPEQFVQFVSPASTKLFSFIKNRRGLSSFFVCGHAQKNLEVMCDCGPDNVSVDENIPLEVIRDLCTERGISFGGNMRLTTVLLNGTPERSAVHAYECLEKGGGTGYVLSPGCDLPYGVPSQNLKAVAEVVHDEYKKQVAAELAEHGGHLDENLAAFDLSDYGNTDRVVVDIITLDSEACTPCQYMVESVKEVLPQFEELVVWREHKIKYQDSVAFMSSLMVKNVPTIVIDGKIKFVSRIPTRDELVSAIQDRINEKLRIKIKRKRARVTIINDGSEKSQQAFENVKTAVRELGLDIEVELAEDENLAKSYGATGLPAVIVSSSELKSAGRVPETKVAKEWLKGLT